MTLIVVDLVTTRDDSNCSRSRDNRDDSNFNRSRDNRDDSYFNRSRDNRDDANQLRGTHARKENIEMLRKSTALLLLDHQRVNDENQSIRKEMTAFKTKSLLDNIFRDENISSQNIL